MVQILTDADVARSCTASRAVRVMRQAIAAHAEGRLAAPPRAYTPLESGPMVYTAGGLRRRVHGVRIYDYAGSEQAVVVWNSETGRLAALAVGDELGRRRTGAIGAVAIDALARPDANTLGIVGTGDQAWAQVWAATAVRHWRRVTIYGRRFSAREAFAARCRDDLLVDAVAVDSAERAVRGRDVVIIATNSSTPVIDMSWISPGTHVTTLGPKTVTAHEMPLDLADQADVLVTDSLSQVRAYPEPYALPTDRMVELGALVAGTVPGRRTRDQITVFCSVGLAGTEVVLAADLAGIGTEVPQAQVRTQRHRAAPAGEVIEELGPEPVVVALVDTPVEPIRTVDPALLAEPTDEGLPMPGEPAPAPAPAAAKADKAADSDETTVRPEIAAELRAAVAELAAIPTPRVPETGDDSGAQAPADAALLAGTAPTESAPADNAPAGAAPAKAEAKPAAGRASAKDSPNGPAAGGPGAKLPTRPVPGVRSAKDILAAAAADKAAADQPATEKPPAADDSLKTLDEIFAFSDLTGDKPPTITAKPNAKPGDAKPAEDTTTEDAKPQDAKPDGAKPQDAKPEDAKPEDAKPEDAKPDGAKPVIVKSENAKPDDVKPATDDAKSATDGAGKAAGSGSPAAVAKVVSRRDTPARVGSQGRGGQPGRGSGQRGGGQSGNPHRDRPTGGNES